MLFKFKKSKVIIYFLLIFNFYNAKASSMQTIEGLLQNVQEIEPYMTFLSERMSPHSINPQKYIDEIIQIHRNHPKLIRTADILFFLKNDQDLLNLLRLRDIPNKTIEIKIEFNEILSILANRIGKLLEKEFPPNLPRTEEYDSIQARMNITNDLNKNDTGFAFLGLTTSIDAYDYSDYMAHTIDNKNLSKFNRKEIEIITHFILTAMNGENGFSLSYYPIDYLPHDIYFIRRLKRQLLYSIISKAPLNIPDYKGRQDF
jgi:hypothetical protein